MLFINCCVRLLHWLLPEKIPLLGDLQIWSPHTSSESRGELIRFNFYAAVTCLYKIMFHQYQNYHHLQSKKPHLTKWQWRGFKTMHIIQLSRSEISRTPCLQHQLSEEWRILKFLLLPLFYKKFYYLLYKNWRQTSKGKNGTFRKNSIRVCSTKKKYNEWQQIYLQFGIELYFELLWMACGHNIRQ